MNRTYLRHMIVYCIGLYLGCYTSAYGYTFGMLSHDDTVESIQQIEKQYQMKLSMISFIRDHYDQQAQGVVTQLGNTLGTGRIYHITASPREHTAEEVYNGYYDWEYSLLFKHIKQQGIKVIFRTMHEMNGGRYPRSGNPEMFKKARIHVYQLSRQAGLNQSQILFDFSTNGWDMPTVGGEAAHQGAQLIKCTPAHKKATGCLSRTDYYPGDQYVDLMGVTFYNRGKATSDRARLSPIQIMEEKEFSILARLKQKNKPIIIDEVGTTSVWYHGTYNRDVSINYYRSNSGQTLKNQWITQLTQWVSKKPEIVGLNYFNVDRTLGLAWENPGEADWSAIDLDRRKFYSSIMKLYQGGDTKLFELFVDPVAKQKEHIGTWSIKKKKKSNQSSTGGTTIITSGTSTGILSPSIGQ